MKKTWKSLILTAALSLTLTIPALGGAWQSDAAGYWYQKDDGSYPVSCWQWIDGNQDGIAENYCFNDKGYLLVSTTTPDGYTVNADGAWTVNGIVQTQAAPLPMASSQDQTDLTAIPAQSQNQTAQAAIPSPDQDQTEQTAIPSQTQDQASRTVSSAGSTGVSRVPYDGYTIIVNTNTKKYHVPTCRSVKTIKSSNLGYSDNATALNALGYVPCKNCH